jgi:pimeloyl-ACP methyl ester carboxylesterase
MPAPTPETCADLKAIQAPALIVKGSTTLPTFAANADVVAGCLPHAEQATIEGVGHGGPADAPDAFATLLLDFVDAQ